MVPSIPASRPFPKRQSSHVCFKTALVLQNELVPHFSKNSFFHNRSIIVFSKLLEIMTFFNKCERRPALFSTLKDILAQPLFSC